MAVLGPRCRLEAASRPSIPRLEGRSCGSVARFVRKIARALAPRARWQDDGAYREEFAGAGAYSPPIMNAPSGRLIIAMLAVLNYKNYTPQIINRVALIM